MSLRAKHLPDGSPDHGFGIDTEPGPEGLIGKTVTMPGIDIGNKARHLIDEAPQPVRRLETDVADLRISASLSRGVATIRRSRIFGQRK